MGNHISFTDINNNTSKIKDKKVNINEFIEI